MQSKYWHKLTNVEMARICANYFCVYIKCQTTGLHCANIYISKPLFPSNIFLRLDSKTSVNLSGSSKVEVSVFLSMTLRQVGQAYEIPSLRLLYFFAPHSLFIFYFFQSHTVCMIVFQATGIHKITSKIPTTVLILAI
jgi:hypothetical protein